MRVIDLFTCLLAPAGTHKVGDKVTSGGKDYWIAGQAKKPRPDGMVQYWLYVEDGRPTPS